LSGVTVIVKAAHVRLCHSQMLSVRAYPRETQEMVFDAHNRAFALFKSAPIHAAAAVQETRRAERLAANNVLTEE
jgi:hypothetical protein